MKVTKLFQTETAHRLHFHPGRCQYIHGHSYKWEVSLISPQLDLNGMLVDFGELKEKVGPIIDQFDHALVLYNLDPILDVAREWIGISNRFVIMDMTPTAENMADLVAREVAKLFPNCNVEIKLWETANSFVTAHTE